MAWQEFNYFFPFNLDALNHAIVMTGSFLPPYTREEKLSFGIMASAGIEPGPPESLASTLSITPWPLGQESTVSLLRDLKGMSLIAIHFKWPLEVKGWTIKDAVNSCNLLLIRPN